MFCPNVTFTSVADTDGYCRQTARAIAARHWQGGNGTTRVIVADLLSANDVFIVGWETLKSVFQQY